MDNLETLIAAVPRPEPSEALDRRIELLLAEARPAPPRRPHRRKWLAGLAAAAAVARLLVVLRTGREPGPDAGGRAKQTVGSLDEQRPGSRIGPAARDLALRSARRDRPCRQGDDPLQRPAAGTITVYVAKRRTSSGCRSSSSSRMNPSVDYLASSVFRGDGPAAGSSALSGSWAASNARSRNRAGNGGNTRSHSSRAKRPKSRQ